jgi:uncharacterized membrane protein YkvA (DUF1232 family)
MQAPNLAIQGGRSHFFFMKKATMHRSRIDEILRPVDASENDRREADVRDNFWRTVKRAARHIPFMEDVVASYYAAMDRDTPLRVRGTLLAALAYFVLPIDMVPDFIFGLGFTDDIAVLTAAITSIQRHIKPAHRAAARKALENDGRSDTAKS